MEQTASFEADFVAALGALHVLASTAALSRSALNWCSSTAMIRLDQGTIGETAMSKQFISISLATVATLGAFAMSVESASAIPRPTSSIPISHGFGRPASSGPGSIKPIHVHRHVHWGHRYRWGVYAAPIYVNYARPCYFVRRPAGLFKVCPVY